MVSGPDKTSTKRIRRGLCCGCNDVKRLLYREIRETANVHVLYETGVHLDDHTPAKRRTCPWRRYQLAVMKSIVEKSDPLDTTMDIFARIPKQNTIECGVDFVMFRNWLTKYNKRSEKQIRKTFTLSEIRGIISHLVSLNLSEISLDDPLVIAPPDGILFAQLLTFYDE